jgi:hypothetical protein
MLAPDGPLPISVPTPTDRLVAPAVEFMLAGLPQMQGPELTATVTAPLVLELTGPGAITVTVQPATGPHTLLAIEAGATGTTRIRSAATDFIAWGTKRKPWRDFCELTGDQVAAVGFLDCLDII